MRAEDLAQEKISHNFPGGFTGSGPLKCFSGIMPAICRQVGFVAYKGPEARQEAEEARFALEELG